MWFIHESALESVRNAEKQRANIAPEVVNSALESRLQLQQDNGPDIYQVNQGVATVAISGVLSKHYSYFYGIFGGGSTSYHDIAASIALAESDENVSEIHLIISSGGGRVDGLTDALDAITAAEKPIYAIVDGMAASAAYALASAADKIFAMRETDLFGSVGVVQGFFLDPEIKEITNRKSPDKRPDVSTPEGVSTVQDELDPVHDLLVNRISRGRSSATGLDITAEVVNSDFGKGAVVIAPIAQNKRMIDGFVANDLNAVNNTVNTNIDTPAGATESKGEQMNIDQLKKDHKDLYDAIKQEGHDAGVKAERDRCTAHLVGGKSAGLLDKAIAAVQNGDEITAAVTMEYATAAANQASASQRSEENTDTGTTQAADTDAAAKEREALAFADAVAAEMGAELKA